MIRRDKRGRVACTWAIDRVDFRMRLHLIDDASPYPAMTVTRCLCGVGLEHVRYGYRKAETLYVYVEPLLCLACLKAYCMELAEREGAA